MKAQRRVIFLVALTALTLIAAACGGGTGSGRYADLTGDVNVDGSSTVFPITQAVAEEFNAEAPNVKVAVGVSGTGGGFEKFCNGETDISDASRPITDDEVASCKAKGIEFVELQVALDGLSVLVNPGNDFVSCLTVEELNSIWAPDSSIKSWSQVRAGFPNRPLKLYGPGTDSGTFDYFTDAINGEEGASRSDFEASEDDNVLVQGIAGDPNALGYFGYAYYAENTDKLKALAVDGGAGCVEPTPETINDGTYKPLSRPLFVYVSSAALGKPQVVAFVDFYLETMNVLAADVGYVELPDHVLAEVESSWTEFKV